MLKRGLAASTLLFWKSAVRQKGRLLWDCHIVRTPSHINKSWRIKYLAGYGRMKKREERERERQIKNVKESWSSQYIVRRLSRKWILQSWPFQLMPHESKTNHPTKLVLNSWCTKLWAKRSGCFKSFGVVSHLSFGVVYSTVIDNLINCFYNPNICNFFKLRVCL